MLILTMGGHQKREGMPYLGKAGENLEVEILQKEQSCYGGAGMVKSAASRPLLVTPATDGKRGHRLHRAR